jgi:hypothetical protein
MRTQALDLTPAPPSELTQVLVENRWGITITNSLLSFIPSTGKISIAILIKSITTQKFTKTSKVPS